MDCGVEGGVCIQKDLGICTRYISIYTLLNCRSVWGGHQMARLPQAQCRVDWN